MNNLQLNGEFDNWEQVEKLVSLYSKEWGFGVVKARVEYDSDDKMVTRRRTFACRRNRNYEPKKDITSDNIHNRTSTKTGCQWKATFSFPKTSSVVKLTSIIDEHNHDLVSPPIAPQLIPQWTVSKRIICNISM